MAEVLYHAIPFLPLLLALEYLAFRRVRDEHRAELIANESRDTRTSLTMGLGNVASNFVWKFAVLAACTGMRDKLGVIFRGPGWAPPGVAESEATRG
jgi:hypothetical protein